MPMAPDGFRVFLTAAEAFPALEEAVLGATHRISASFRVFDPDTRLRSDAGRAVGATWQDLIAHVLARGVAVRMVLADFDPIGRDGLHRQAHRSLRGLHAAAAQAGPDARLDAVAVRHPSRISPALRAGLWPFALARLRGMCRDLNAAPPDDRDRRLAEMPALAAMLTTTPTGRLRPRPWPMPHLFPVTHHQKLAVIDDRQLYIGGLDLDERRFDTKRHDRDADQTWHDVQVMVTGPIVAEARAHLDSFLDVTAGRAPPPAARHLLRTLSAPYRGGQGGGIARFSPRRVCHDIADAHHRLLGQAERLVYLETQFFRDLRLARALAVRAQARPDLGLVLMLPAAPEDVAFSTTYGIDARFGEYLQTRALRIVRRAFGARMFVGSPAQPRRDADSRAPRARLVGAPIVYIHAKVSIFDDSAAIVSSANLNGRSFYWDTEAGVLLRTRPEVAHLRRRVMGHWLPPDPPEDLFDPARAVAAWRRLGTDNAARRPEDRQGFVLPYDIARAEHVALPVPGVPPEMV